MKHLLASIFLVTHFAHADVKFVIPVPPGGSADTIARILAPELEKIFNEKIIVENRPGASGTIAANHVAKISDSRTFLISNTSLIQTPAFMVLPYDAYNNLIPVIMTASSFNYLVVNPQLGVKSVAELVEYVKKNPNKTSYGSFGNASSPHINGALFSQQSKIDSVHIPYKGAALVANAILSRKLTFAFVDSGTISKFVKAGTVIPLGVTGIVPVSNLPTMKSLGYRHFEMLGWHGIHAAKATDVKLSKKIADSTREILKLKDIVAKFEILGVIPGNITRVEFNRSIEFDAPIYNKIIARDLK